MIVAMLGMPRAASGRRAAALGLAPARVVVDPRVAGRGERQAALGPDRPRGQLAEEGLAVVTAEALKRVRLVDADREAQARWGGEVERAGRPVLAVVEERELIGPLAVERRRQALVEAGAGHAQLDRHRAEVLKREVPAAGGQI